MRFLPIRALFVAAVISLPGSVGANVVAAAAAGPACPASVISAGDTYSGAISNGQLFTWGRNVDGELGIGFQGGDFPTPIAVKSNPNLTKSSGVWMGFITAFVVDPTGQLWTFGQNVNNQTGLGDVTTGGQAFVTSPTPVSGPTNVVSVGASFDHTVAVTSNGTVWGWGQSPGLGIGDVATTVEAPAILQVPPRVVKATAGFRYTILLTSDGTLYGTGVDISGQLGLGGGPVIHPTFEAIPGVSGIVDVSATESIGESFTLALDKTGHVFAFGSNGFGQTGIGTPQFPLTVLTPTQVPGLDSVIQVAAGGRTSYALKSDGTVWSWGSGQFGALGTGAAGPTSVPAQIPLPAGTKIVSIAAGPSFDAMALDSVGNIWVWGDDTEGALGTGVVGKNQPTPVKISLGTTCPAPPPPPGLATITSLSPSFGQAEGATLVTITGTNFTNADHVQFGVNQPLLPPCTSTSSVYCFTVVDDSHITATTLPHPPGNVDVSVDNVAGISATVPADVYAYEGWIAPTPTDRSAFDVPIGQSTSFTVQAQEQGTFTIGHSSLPPFVQCVDAVNPGNPAEVTCTVTPTGSTVVPISFFDAANPSRLTTRTYVVGRGWYAGLGDSFSAGDGNEPYIGVSASDGCHRSFSAHPNIIAGDLYGGQNARFVACAGAVIRNVVVGKGGEASQLNALDSSVDLVTISIGGNDIEFSKIATSCLLLGTICKFQLDAATAQAIARIGNEANAGHLLDPSSAPGSSSDPIYTLDNIYATIRARAPNARILVVGYPDLLPHSGPCITVLMNAATVDWLNSVAKFLNDTIQQEALRSGAEYVDLSNAFVGHDLCAAQSYVNFVLNPPFFETPIHPNEQGQARMAQLTEAQIASGPPGSQFLVGFNQTVTTTTNVSSGVAQATFSTTWPGSDVVMTLVSPSGRTITRSTSASDVYHLLGPTYEVFSVTNPEAGTWTVEMKGTNVSADGETVRLSTTQSLPVNLPPIARFTSSVTNGTAPLAVAFDATGSSDPDGTVTDYSWDFGDGSAGTGATPSHVFTKPGTYSVHLTVTDNGGAQGFATADVLVREATQLSYTGATSGDFDDTARLSATLTGAITGPIAGALVNFTIAGAGGTQSCGATTDASGAASCDLALTLQSGAYTVTAHFAQTDKFAAASTSAAFTVSKEETSLTYTGPQAVEAGSSATFSASLAEDGKPPIAGRTVTFTLGSGPTKQTCSATTNATGVASCSISVAQHLGPSPLTISFGGDTFYASASTTASVVVFGFATGGAFVIGDQAGSSVTFWSDRWQDANTLSGGSAPGDFKGFENSSAAPVCRVDWTSSPANSSGPPASVPEYMAVVVTSHVKRSGATITGDTVHVVVVHVMPGYANDPGHAGTGTVVAVIC
ncbi:MAG TPA: PKD domain-containing protein [Candidatus Dormibacteraeota bacterium]|nr:PKD domain-containing protein [Candidatus Dormibacteraeota bacterium]